MTGPAAESVEWYQLGGRTRPTEATPAGRGDKIAPLGPGMAQRLLSSHGDYQVTRAS